MTPGAPGPALLVTPGFPAALNAAAGRKDAALAPCGTLSPGGTLVLYRLCSEKVRVSLCSENLISRENTFSGRTFIRQPGDRYSLGIQLGRVEQLLHQ